MNEVERKVAELFMPYAMDRIAGLKAKNTPFVHYTSAYAALQVIKSGEMWMRNALVMNDFTEVQYGQFCLEQSWKDETVGGRLRNLLNRLDPGLSDTIEEAFDARSMDRYNQSYLISLSEHGDIDHQEDRYGRLSMWRAYGGATNVALVFRNAPFMLETSVLTAFTSPVLYRDAAGFKSKFSEMIDGLEANFDLLESEGSLKVANHLIWALHFAVLSTKHPGFAEEREWRVVYSPTMARSDKIKHTIETIQGVPQKVYKLEMKDYPDDGFVGAELPSLLEEIIIGPTASPQPIYEALSLALEERGVPDAWKKVRVSDIPLRR